jgi:SnoaL-like protein
MSDPEVEVVHDWHVALNAGDTSRLLALSTSDVEVGGPRGTGRGSQLLEEWVARAQIRLEPLRWKARADVVVVEQTARWRTPEGDLSEPQTAASVFRVVDGKVAGVIRLDNFEQALEFAGIQPSPPP